MLSVLWGLCPSSLDRCNSSRGSISTERRDDPLIKSISNHSMGRARFLLSSLLVVLLCGAALRLTHSHPDSKRVSYAAGYGVAILGVFWTRCLADRFNDAGLPRWTFWPCFLVVFTGSLAAHLLKFTNTLETLGLFLVLQLPAIVFSSERTQAEPLPTTGNADEESNSVSKPREKPARAVTPIGSVEFAVYAVLIAGLWAVLHLLRGDVALLPMARALRYGLDAGSVLLAFLWMLSVRGRFSGLGLRRWAPGYCSVVLVGCAVPAALKIISFQNALIIFTALQMPAVILRREFIPASLVQPESSQVVGPKL